MADQYFQMKMDDCATAAFVSFYKNFYGTLDEVSAFVDAIRNDENLKGKYEGLKEAHDKFISGDTQVKHAVAFNFEPYLTPVKLLQEVSFSIGAKEWTHINAWDCPYYMRCKGAAGTVQWFDVGNGIAKSIRVRFNDLQYGIDEKDYSIAGTWCWGIPHMLELEEPYLYNRLSVEEHRFNSAEDADIDVPKLDNLDFTTFCDEIFGDG